MTREEFLKMTGASLFALAAGNLGKDAFGASNSRAKPNVVFILADDLGWSDTTLYGTTQFYETPNIERLANRGMTFVNAYAANPLCSPTRASIMTGLYPARLGFTQAAGHLPAVRTEATLTAKAPPYLKALQPVSATRLKTEYYTLAEAFRDGGYATGHFGKWHLGPEPYSPREQGFDVDVPHSPGPGPAGTYVAPWHFPEALHFTGEPGEHIEDRMSQEAMKFIEANRDRPFFMNYWAFSVHAPFDAKKELIEKYRGKADPENPQRSAVYAAMVQSLDENVGRLLDKLDELKLSENTIIVFFSDNGGNTYELIEGIAPTSNAPLRSGKASNYEGGVREPCIVVWPGKVKPATRSEAFVSSVDWYPTLMDMTGVTPKETVPFDGVSQIPALMGMGAPRDAIFSYFPHYISKTGARPAVSVRRGDWKLIRFYCDGPGQEDRFELYNLKKDIGETENLAAQEPKRVVELNTLIDGFHKNTGALVPTKNPGYDPNAVEPAPAKVVKKPEPKKEPKDIRP